MNFDGDDTLLSKVGTLSAYQPSEEIRALTNVAKRDYAWGETILHRPWFELNNRNVIEDENWGQIMINAYVDESYEDPSQAWKWRGTRSMARNRAIAMHANLTTNFILPMFIAQNDDDDTQRDFSEVMRDIVDWMTQPTNSNYQSSFLDVVFGMLSNPVTYMGAEYAEIMQIIKIRQEDGSYTTKEILDDVLSGFRAPVWSSAQVLITNAYERNIQKQRSIWKRRYCEKQELAARWGNHPNWQFVKPGIRSIWSAQEGLFYEVKDYINPNLVADEVYMDRRRDIEVHFLNGIYMGEENIENNLIHHRNQNGAPRYDIVPFGYSRIGQHFYFYKSMMSVLKWDNSLYDAQTEAFMNRSFLEAEMPIVTSGGDKIDSDVVFPNSVISSESPNFKAAPLLPPSNLSALQAAMAATEKSLDDASMSTGGVGGFPTSSRNSIQMFVIAAEQAQMKKLVQDVAKSLGESMCQLGDLMKDIVINNITVPQVDQLVGPTLKLKYHSFILAKTKGNLKTSKRIIFDPDLIGAKMTDKEKKHRGMKMLEDMGYPNHDYDQVLVNPELFAKYNYLTRMDLEELIPKNAEYWQPILQNMVTTLVNNPWVNMKDLTSEMMTAFFQSRGQKFVNDKPTPPPGAQQQDPNNVTPEDQPAPPPNTTLGGKVQSRLLSTAARAGVANA